MAQNLCRRQFKCRNFGFRCKDEEKNLFYHSQWGSNRVLFLAYRLFMFLYSVGWTLAWYIYWGVTWPERVGTAYRYLTMWGEFGNTIYFTLAFALSVVGVVRRNRSSRTENGGIKFLRSATWIIFGLASVVQIIILVGYWSLLAPNASPESLRNHFNIHQHLITAILILIDLSVAGFPIRLLHFIYATLGGVTYITLTVILHITGVTSAVYPFLNWGKNPGLAGGIAVGLAFIGTVVVQCIIFGLYCLRLQIYEYACTPRPAKPTHRPHVVAVSENNDSGVANPTYYHDNEGGQKSVPNASDYF